MPMPNVSTNAKAATLITLLARFVPITRHLLFLKLSTSILPTLRFIRLLAEAKRWPGGLEKPMIFTPIGGFSFWLVTFAAAATPLRLKLFQYIHRILVFGIQLQGFLVVNRCLIFVPSSQVSLAKAVVDVR